MFGGVLVSVGDTFTAVMPCFLHRFSHLASPRWSSHVERLLLRSAVQRHAPPPPLPLAPSGPATPRGPGQTHLTRPGAWPRGAQGLEWPHLTGTDDSEQEWSTFGGEFQKDNSGSEAGKPGWGRGAGDRARHAEARGTVTRCDVVVWSLRPLSEYFTCKCVIFAAEAQSAHTHSHSTTLSA